VKPILSHFNTENINYVDTLRVPHTFLNIICSLHEQCPQILLLCFVHVIWNAFSTEQHICYALCTQHEYRLELTSLECNTNVHLQLNINSWKTNFSKTNLAL
jgi:hypothetical protein